MVIVYSIFKIIKNMEILEIIRLHLLFCNCRLKFVEKNSMVKIGLYIICSVMVLLCPVMSYLRWARNDLYFINCLAQRTIII